MRLVIRDAEYAEWYAKHQGGEGLPMRFLTEAGRRLRALVREKVGRAPDRHGSLAAEYFVRWVLRPGEKLEDFYILRDWLMDLGYPEPRIFPSDLPGYFGLYFPDPSTPKERALVIQARKEQLYRPLRPQIPQGWSG